MVSLKTIAEGLSKQIQAAIDGKADAVQSDILCKSVDTIIRLARFQVEMGIEGERVIQPSKSTITMDVGSKVIEMTVTSSPTAVPFPAAMAATEPPEFDTSTMPTDDLKRQIKISETALSHAENDAMKAKSGSPAEARAESAAKEIRKHIIAMRDELATR